MKKILALIIALTLLLTIEVFGTTINFTDIEQKDWFYKNLKELTQKDIVGGYPDGTFKPNNDLKFEEFIKMVVIAVSDKPIELTQGQEWYQIYIDIAKENKYINEELTKLIGQNIDRKTMAEIIYNILSNKEDFNEYTTEEITYLNSKLTDLTNSDTKTLTISGLGIICGYPDGTFKPSISLRRCETVAIISRLINKDMRLPVKIDLIEVISPIENELPKVDLSHLYTYPTLSGLSVKEENETYYKYGEEYIQTVVDDNINYMSLTHNRDYETINNNEIKYKSQLLYYLNGYKEYQGKKYSQLRKYYLDYYNKTNNQEMVDFVLSENSFIEFFMDKWVKDTIDNKVKVHAEFYTENGLLHDTDGFSAIRGILRIKYDSHYKPSNIKEELDLVQREIQAKGQRVLGLDDSKYDIYMDYDEIPNFEVGKWYEIDMDIVVSSQSFVHGLEEKASLNYEYIYPIAIREIK